MLKAFLLTCSFFLVFSSYGINDYSKLKETIYFFGNAVKAGQDLPEEFKITYEEFAKSSSLDYESEELKNQFESYSKYNLYDYERLKEIEGKVKKIISFDTVTYVSFGEFFINVSIVYSLNSKAQKKWGLKTVRTLTRFNVIDNKLRIAKKVKVLDDYRYELKEMELVQDIREGSFNNSFKKYLFLSSTDNYVPYRLNNKWGLTSLQNGKKSLLVYDMVFPFQRGYARVLLNDKFNLLDSLNNEVFEEWKEEIFFDKKGYKILMSTGEYKFFNGEINVSRVDSVTQPIVSKELIPKNSSNEGLLTAGPRNQEWKERKPVLKVKHKELPAVVLRDSLSDYYRQSSIYLVREKYKVNENQYHVVQKTIKDTLLYSILYPITSFDTLYSFISSRARTLGEFVVKVQNNETIVMDKARKELFKTRYVTNNESPGYLDLYDREKRLFGMYCPYTNVYIEPKYQYIQAVDRDRFFIVRTKDGKLGYLDAQGKELF